MKCKNCKSDAVSGKTLCRPCLEIARTKTAQRRIKLLTDGLCISCGKIKHLLEKELCQACADKKSTATAKRKEKYFTGNLCIKCARSKSFVLAWHNTLCAGCHLKYKMKLDCTKEFAETIINNLLVKQNYRCALTNRDLRTNRYHIDHIIPRSIDSSNISDPNNWQLVVEDANMFKEDMSQESVIALARDIVVKALQDGVICFDDLTEGVL